MPTKSRHWWHRRRSESGAVLVEAALVIPILLLFVFGTIDFGWTFNEYLSVRQGVREAAREVVITTLPQPGTGTWASNGCVLATGNNVPSPQTAANAGIDFNDMICYAKSRIGLGMGASTRVSIAWDTTTGWTPSTTNTAIDSVVVCAQYQVNSLTGAFGAILNHYIVTSQTEIRIEVASPDIVGAIGLTSPIHEPSLSASWPASCSTV